MRILITDGDKKYREQAQAFLWQRGHDARVAADGLECAEILRNYVPEILVLNCDLLWGGYQGVMALINETPRLSQTQMETGIRSPRSARQIHITTPLDCQQGGMQ